MATFAFRWRFVLGNHMRLNIFVPEWPITDPDSGEFIRLKAVGPVSETNAGGPTIESTNNVSLWGSPYSSERDARAAAERWSAYLQAAFARLNVGADFGRRSAHSAFTDYGLAMLEASQGRRVLNDAHGLSIFEIEPQPVFVAQSIEHYLGKPEDKLREAVEQAEDLDYAPGSRETLAYDLYSASFFEFSADARFVMLMMAVETLMTQRERSNDALSLVEAWIKSTKNSDLLKQEKESLLGSLRFLRKESLKSAGKRLALESLGERKYLGESPDKFFSEAYDLRSALVHGQDPRPSRDEVDARAGELERFVGDLLSGPLLNAVNVETFAPDSLPVVVRPQEP